VGSRENGRQRSGHNPGPAPHPTTRDTMVLAAEPAIGPAGRPDVGGRRRRKAIHASPPARSARWRLGAINMPFIRGMPTPVRAAGPSCLAHNGRPRRGNEAVARPSASSAPAAPTLLRPRPAPRSSFAALEVVEGAVPVDFPAGHFLRVGPNAARGPVPEAADCVHWLDGDGLVSIVRFGGGRVEDASCAYVETQGLLDEADAGEPLFGTFKLPPQPRLILGGLLHKIRHWARADSPYWVIQLKNASNTALVAHAGRLFSLYEAGSPYEFKLERCEDGGATVMTTVGPADLGPAWRSWEHTFTAHPRHCPRTGRLAFTGYDMLAARFFFGELDETDGKLVAAGVRPFKPAGGKGTLLHDFGLTETRAVFYEMPLHLDVVAAMRGEGNRMFGFDPAAPSFIGVVRREDYFREGGGDLDVTWIPTETGSVYHVLNAWDCPERPSVVIFVAARSDETTFGGVGYVKGGFAEGSRGREEVDAYPTNELCYLTRWEVDGES